MTDARVALRPDQTQRSTIWICLYNYLRPLVASRSDPFPTATHPNHIKATPDRAAPGRRNLVRPGGLRPGSPASPPLSSIRPHDGVSGGPRVCQVRIPIRCHPRLRRVGWRRCFRFRDGLELGEKLRPVNHEVPDHPRIAKQLREVASNHRELQVVLPPSRGDAGSDEPGTSGDFVEEVGSALRRVRRNGGPSVKHVAIWAGESEKTATNWFAGRYRPNGAHLVGAARHSDDVLVLFLALAGREHFMAAMRRGASVDSIASCWPPSGVSATAAPTTRPDVGADGSAPPLFRLRGWSY